MEAVTQNKHHRPCKGRERKARAAGAPQRSGGNSTEDVTAEAVTQNKHADKADTVSASLLPPMLL